MSHESVPRWLVTTADQRAWPAQGPLLFLGGWCRRLDQRELWEGRDWAQAPPYGWEPGQREADYARVGEIHERLLAELREALNARHGVSRSLRYWRILLGMWLHQLTATAYNRWQTIHAAGKAFPIAGTTLLRFGPEAITPRDTSEAFHRRVSPERDHAICARVIAGWSGLPHEWADPPPGGADLALPGSLPPSGLKRRAVAAYARLASRLSRPGDAFLQVTGLPRRREMELQLRLGQFPALWRSPAPPLPPADPASREALALGAESHAGFGQFVRRLLPEFFPTIFWEGYEGLLATVERAGWPQRPRLILTANSFSFDEVFKAYAAARAEEGSRYCIAQHGAKYGADRFVYTETHETACADRYLTWGWSDGNPKCRPAVAQKLMDQSEQPWDPAGGLMLVQVCADLRTAPWDQIHLFELYSEQQHRFMGLLDPAVRARTTVRLHPAYISKGTCDDLRWEPHLDGAALDRGNGPLAPRLAQTRLVVHTYSATGFLENMAQNLPTILFYDPWLWPLRDSAQEVYGQLAEAGLFFSNPEDAARAVARVWDDVAAWWGSPAVQRARAAFCRLYAHLPAQPLRAFKEALRPDGR